jgi:hypothetical protein
MVPSEQLRAGRPGDRAAAAPCVPSPWAAASPSAERAARVALRAQVGRLERELSVLVAGRFPHISPHVGSASGVGVRGRPHGEQLVGGRRPACSRASDGASDGGPRLLSLADLERERDSLVLRVRAARGQTARRDELEHDARELLERMRARPAQYKFVRLPVAALGERGCGVWEVRPRLGLIGMLAGWWQLKLSSGCPLPRGSRASARPPLLAEPTASASQVRRRSLLIRRRAPARARGD